MGLFDFFKGKNDSKKQQTQIAFKKPVVIRDSPGSYVDASFVSPDERPYYQPDNYYTYYSYPGTGQGTRVITFEERKKKSYPSKQGLYVPEILLLDYCNTGKYPKPSKGYPGFWWFEYGIRDVGHALQSLEERGFLQWASPFNSLNALKVAELKKILTDADLDTSGKKADLIERIRTEISEEKLNIPGYIPKYELTDMGKEELENNAYVPYMHKHKSKTIEGCTGEFTVWSINRKYPDGDASSWRKDVGNIERRRFGVNMAKDYGEEKPKPVRKNCNTPEMREEMRRTIASYREFINKSVMMPGDGFEEEMQALAHKSNGDDKEALVRAYISIGKRFDAPALYRETAILLRKYGMYDEELEVLNAGLKNIPASNWHRDEIKERKEKVLQLIQKQEKE